MLDTPPTTNALDFLEAPDRLAIFFSERVIVASMPAAQGRDVVDLRLFSTAPAPRRCG